MGAQSRTGCSQQQRPADWQQQQLVEYDGGGLHRHVYVADMNRLMWYLMVLLVILRLKYR
jgi:hypothetical protein